MGSAFPISEKRLLTNAHVVADGHLIHVRKCDGHKKFVAKIEAMCFECDLALLSVDNDSFWNDLHPLAHIDGLPSLQDAVMVVGFPDAPSGGETICVTQGVVSRIDLHNYSWDSRLLVVQIDAAINPGNSGGPCIDQQANLIGVAFQKGTEAGTDNIGYIIPMPVVEHFLKCCASGRFGFADPGFTWNCLDNPSLRGLVQVPEDVSGVLVVDTVPLAPAKQLLEAANDVITRTVGSCQFIPRKPDVVNVDRKGRKRSVRKTVPV